MKKWLKAINIIVIIALIKVVQSCILFPNCECSDEVFYYSINSIEITNIDNSQTYPQFTEEDEMHKAAVAFNVLISDTTLTENYAYSQPLQSSIGFSTALAWSCDCSMNYLPEPTIQNFNIFTNFDINDTVKAGDDVSNLFLVTDYSWSNRDLYYELNELINLANLTTNEMPGILLKIFLKVPVDNSKAEFTIEITLSNDTKISQTTNTITII